MANQVSSLFPKTSSDQPGTSLQRNTSNVIFINRGSQETQDTANVMSQDVTQRTPYPGSFGIYYAASFPGAERIKMAFSFSPSCLGDSVLLPSADSSLTSLSTHSYNSCPLPSAPPHCTLKLNCPLPLPSQVGCVPVFNIFNMAHIELSGTQGVLSK